MESTSSELKVKLRKPFWALFFGMRVAIATLFLFVSFAAMAQKHPAYTLYNSKGKKVSFKKMVRKLEKADVVFLGESHNNPISHWLQLEIAQKLDETKNIAIGAEMFERDNEEALQAYMSGTIDAQKLDSIARLWKNFTTDYKPLVDYARAHDIRYVSTNIPRRYASQVYREGLESLEKLTAEEKSWIAPLPIAFDAELPGYQNMLGMMEGHAAPTFPMAQAIKDATMAHFILANYTEGELFIHLNGSYHSDNHGTIGGEGIVWYLKKERPDLEHLTVTTVSQKDVSKLEKEYAGRADFIICVPENMTKTY
ncbi:ChaN family lipoprotein [Roseivirga pacifica]|uniref:ChaN family lipoprotein n=1 Tax=Roseivirga pacifica TaxID=1267423 RepID=UPI003BB0B597